MIYRRYKYMQMGGVTTPQLGEENPWAMQGGNNWGGIGNGIAAGGSVAANMWDNANPPDDYGYDKNLKGKSTLKGAASGAAIGTTILPGWGTAIGAVVGGAAGYFSGNAAQKKALANKRQAISSRLEMLTNMPNQRLNNYDFAGSNNGGYFALGGKLKPLNSDTVEVEGNTHAEGGVKLPEVGAEVENGETISGDYVFSDLLGFADKHKSIAKQIGAIEKKPINRERRVSLEILRKKESALMDQQESIKNMIMNKSGNKMQLGGGLQDLLTSGSEFTEPQGTPQDKLPVWMQEDRQWHGGDTNLGRSVDLYIDDNGDLKRKPPVKIGTHFMAAKLMKPVPMQQDATRVSNLRTGMLKNLVQ